MKRAYAVIMWGFNDEFIGVYTVVDTMEKAEELCATECPYPGAEFSYLTWTPTFYEGGE